MIKAFTSLTINDFAVDVASRSHRLFHRPSDLSVHSDAATGFYFKVDYKLENNRAPLALHPAIVDEVDYISFKDLTSDPVVIATGCGEFACDTGNVFISFPGGKVDYFEIKIISPSVDGFNATVQALKDGGLKPVGSEQTLFQVMTQKVLELENQLASAKANEAININSIEGMNNYLEGYLNKLKHSMFLIREYLACRGEYPDGIENVELARLRDEIRRFKNRTFWQRLWDLPPVPIEKH